jgi:HlyD family secretion protein
MLRLRREQQNAAVIKARANYELQLLNYRNQQALAERNLISEFELLVSMTTLNGLAADLAVAEANLRVIETEINQYAFITSPIDGIVLDRRINVGDTVVDSASTTTSNIFTLAENLREMQIEANVGELDIASIHRGQAVRFTLESLPGRTFSGLVESVRLVPVVTNNVVSYTVIVRVENPDGSLLPGMTCAVDFIVERSENVLVVPNAALRYQPSNLSAERIADMIFIAGLEGMSDEQQQAAIDAREQARAQAQAAGNAGQGNFNTGLAGMLTASNPRGIMTMTSGPGGRQSSAVRQPGQRRDSAALVIRNIWFINGEGRLEVARVQTGITNGSFTEIIFPEDIEGKQIILRERI